jgi:hypothetical protein
MGNVIDMTGQKFGELTVVSFAGGEKWNCKCACGNTKAIRRNNLRSGASRSCGCLKRVASRRRIDLTGQKFGELTVTGYAGIKKNSARWTCRCSCGKTTVVASCPGRFSSRAQVRPASR